MDAVIGGVEDPQKTGVHYMLLDGHVRNDPVRDLEGWFSAPGWHVAKMLVAADSLLSYQVSSQSELSRSVCPSQGSVLVSWDSTCSVLDIFALDVNDFRLAHS